MSLSSKIILKKSSVQDKIPQASDLEFGELALNFADGRIYYKDSSDDIRHFEEVNSFRNIEVSGQTTLSADGGSDTIAFVEGTGISLSTDNTTKSITISSTAEASLEKSTTDDLDEGLTNLYYTDDRVRNAISASGDISYDSSTGEFSFTERTDQEVRNLFSTSGDLSYDSSTGVFSVTTYKSTDFDTDFAGKSTSDLTEGTNLYYTDARVRNALSASGDLSYNSSTGNFSVTTYKTSDFNVDFESKNTDDLSEGLNNLYYTDARVDSHLSGGSGIDYSTGTISHSDTSSQSSVDNSGNTVIQDITLDGFGHITGLSSKTIDPPTLSTLGLDTNDDVQFDSLGIGTSASGTSGEIRATGDIIAHFSDDRLKTRLGTIDSALDKVDTLEGFYYEPNETAESYGYERERRVGLSAQDVQKILPEVVRDAPIGDGYLTLQYEQLVPLLVEAIKELKTEVDDLKKKI